MCERVFAFGGIGVCSSGLGQSLRRLYWSGVACQPVEPWSGWSVGNPRCNADDFAEYLAVKILFKRKDVSNAAYSRQLFR